MEKSKVSDTKYPTNTRGISPKVEPDTIMKSKFLSNFLIAAFTKRVFYFISRDFVPGEFVPRGFVSGDFVPG